MGRKPERSVVGDLDSRHQQASAHYFSPHTAPQMHGMVQGGSQVPHICPRCTTVALDAAAGSSHQRLMHAALGGASAVCGIGVHTATYTTSVVPAPHFVVSFSLFLSLLTLPLQGPRLAVGQAYLSSGPSPPSLLAPLPSPAKCHTPASGASLGLAL
jgi:hypothetical protein